MIPIQEQKAIFEGKGVRCVHCGAATAACIILSISQRTSSFTGEESQDLTSSNNAAAHTFQLLCTVAGLPSLLGVKRDESTGSSTTLGTKMWAILFLTVIG